MIIKAFEQYVSVVLLNCSALKVLLTLRFVDKIPAKPFKSFESVDEILKWDHFMKATEQCFPVNGCLLRYSR